MSASIGILVMLNNFFHDLSVAMFLCSLLGLALVLSEIPAAETEGHRASLARLDRLFRKTAWGSFFFIIAFGAVRAAAYKDFEWYNAVEHGQTAALVIKHILFVVLIGAGLLYIRRLRTARKTGGASCSDVSRRS